MSIRSLTTYQLHASSLLLTLLLSRLALWLTWEMPIMATAKNDSWHHIYTGIILLILAAVLLRKKQKTWAVTTGIGLGLIFDEVCTPFCWLGTPIEYWSATSITLAALATTGYLFYAKQHRFFRSVSR